MRTLSSALSLALICAALPAAVAAHADPTLLSGGPTSPNFFGTTGLLFIPSAYTVGDRGVAGDFYAGRDFESAGGTAGLGQRLEVGGNYLAGHNSGSSGVLANGKFNAIREGTLIPAVSVGVTNAFAQLADDPSVYVVASKDLSKLIPLRALPLQVHGGWGTGLYHSDPFLGAELGFGTPLNAVPLVHPRFSAIAEWDDHQYNVGVRARYRGLAGTVGWFDLNHAGAGLSYTTGIRL